MAKDDDSGRESREILRRVEREAAGGGLTQSAMVGGKTSDDDDWIEHWGTRIGRTAGRVLAAVIVGWIVLYALNVI